MNIVQGQTKWDLLCHHGAMITGYKSPDFDVANNTHYLANVVDALTGSGCFNDLLSGTFSEIG